MRVSLIHCALENFKDIFYGINVRLLSDFILSYHSQKTAHSLFSGFKSRLFPKKVKREGETLLSRAGHQEGSLCSHTLI